MKKLKFIFDHERKLCGSPTITAIAVAAAKYLVEKQHAHPTYKVSVVYTVNNIKFKMGAMLNDPQ